MKTKMFNDGWKNDNNFKYSIMKQDEKNKQTQINWQTNKQTKKLNKIKMEKNENINWS